MRMSVGFLMEFGFFLGLMGTISCEKQMAVVSIMIISVMETISVSLNISLVRQVVSTCKSYPLNIFTYLKDISFLRAY
jgi:hypothetical protein